MQVSLKSARVNSRLTQAQVAEKIGVNPATVLAWELGRTEPKITQYKQLCRLYGIELNDIFLPE